MCWTAQNKNKNPTFERRKVKWPLPQKDLYLSAKSINKEMRQGILWHSLSST